MKLIIGNAIKALCGSTAAASGPADFGINPARTIDELVIRPIRKLLGNTRTEFSSPDGALNLIRLGA